VNRPGSLAGRIALLTIAVTVVTALVAGALSIGLIRAADQTSARRTLASIADASQATADLGTGAVGDTRARRMLRALRVQFATLGPRGNITAASSPLARGALGPADVARLRAGEALSLTRTSAGHRVIVEGRPTNSGAVVLVQQQSDALAGVGRAVRRILLALLVGVAVAALLAVLFARRLAGPLRRTAQAAHALAAGRRDVTIQPEGPAEVAEVGQAVNTLAANLSYSEGRQRNFLMSVSHELRTPLTAITGYAESLATGVVPAGDTGRVGEVLLDEARRLDRLVADLLDLARLDAAEFRIDVVDTDVVALASAAAGVWSGRCAVAGVHFELQAPAGPFVTRTDPARLRQALDGLLENALRVTPSGAPIVLAVRNDAGPLPVLLEVRDGGPGLSESDLAVAFDRSALYERYRGVRRVGTGLGLAIVRGLVVRLGGAVEAGSAAEGGARFTIRLPWAPTS
jgi:two-component system sensor histidine kinase BaeS